MKVLKSEFGRLDGATACNRLIPSLIVIVVALCHPLLAQYTVEWSTIDGGGGTSAGGTYTVNGTIGQPDAASMTGGNYALQGGFWCVLAVVPTPDAPELTIRHSLPGSVVVSWPSPSTGWALQQNADLGIPNWSTPPEAVADDGTNRFITLSPASGSRFFRLTRLP